MEAVAQRLDWRNIAALAADVDVILDGTDNFATRFVINDYAVKHARPWVFAGVIGSEAQVMPVLPGRTACLRCLFDLPPPPCSDPSCRQAGVLGPVVAAVAAMQAAEAVKLLAGRDDCASPYLLKLDLWENRLQRIGVMQERARADRLCCGQRVFEFLDD